MNLLHLKYVIEVQKPAQLVKLPAIYMNQPHLSKTIKDLEENMQILFLNELQKELFQQKRC